MKALSLTQPWASLVACGAKQIETRSWNTAYRGPIAIHAAKSFPRSAKDLANSRMVRTALRWSGSSQVDISGDLPLGAIVALGQLVGTFRTERFVVGCKNDVLDRIIPMISEEEHCFGNYDHERYAWLLADVKRLPTPVPVKGALGLWEWDENRCA